MLAIISMIVNTGFGVFHLPERNVARGPDSGRSGRLPDVAFELRGPCVGGVAG